MDKIINSKCFVRSSNELLSVISVWTKQPNRFISQKSKNTFEPFEKRKNEFKKIN